ncbi:Zn(II)2Cys6 transcription factor [Aspergillus mulundensis]|uniref:Zn(2)-C6 fungal-type domain-containing protein n=1 Tax=Aspergillus mulundensis TaxID=1810919 RepID=A0A3D8QRT1_9EURO|nr:Uncharacterized protein DSM5745_09761 [Aspergillus mulundensis]RDW64350.1 Uncharacterized protein DSM5745_09761 [Aspergillus mulundensis]
MASNKRARIDGDESRNAKPRLTRACADCKEHKTKCFVQPGETACNRCLKSGVECVPHNFARKFLDEDAVWKAEAAAKIDRLHDAVESLLRHNDLPLLASTNNHTVSTSQSLNERGHPSIPILPPPSNVLTETNRGNFTPEGPSADSRTDQDDSDLVPLPMNNLYNLTDANNSQLIRVDPADVNGPDFISQGVLGLSEAEYLFSHYRSHINPLLWDGMLCSHKTLREARQSSSLLVAVVLTVAALHIPNREQSLHATYAAFVSLMRGSCLLRCQNLDVIRALCIGAFYLTSLSWALCSRAVRVATEMNLHKSSLQFARGSLESYERVRLWYVLYVCDHQFALAYGRPPMMHEDAAIRNAEKLLTSGLSSKGDRGLVAQVKLFRILASGYFMHGCDPDLELNGQDFDKLKEFDMSVDQWRLEYHLTSKDALAPLTATALYYHLARFQLNSVALRGISARDTSQNLDMTWERQEASNVAIMAAMNTAKLVVENSDLQKELIGLPIFVHAMIAVCGSFLLKMAVVSGDLSRHISETGQDLAQYGLNFHTKTAVASVERLVHVLSQVADNASQRHVVRQVVTGLDELLQRLAPSRATDHSLLQSRDSLPVNNQIYQRWVEGTEQDPLNLEPNTRGPEYSSSYHEATQGEDNLAIPPDNVRQQDPFDLTGDLDWRFDDGFLFNFEVNNSDFAAFL